MLDVPATPPETLVRARKRARLPGRFEAKPGKWGRRRLPVFIQS
jgi:hypothetical protein